MKLRFLLHLGLLAGLLFLLCTHAVQGQTYTVTTIAGSDTAGYRDGIGTAARFLPSTGLTLDANGNIIIIDGLNNRIRKINRSMIVSTLAGSGNASYADGNGTNASFYNPKSIVADDSGNVYISDSRCIRRINQLGNVTTFAGSFGPSGFLDGIGTNARFSDVKGLGIDANGNLYVSDANSYIRKITPAGVVTTISDSLGRPLNVYYTNGITIDRNGNIFIAEEFNHRIRKITPSGVITTFAGSGSAGFSDGIGISASFNQPHGLTIASNGDLLVTDFMNHRIRKITPSGVVSTIAGSGNRVNIDGVGTAASFNSPIGIAIGNNGFVYVTDWYSIRRITSLNCQTPPTPTIFAGGALAFCRGGSTTLISSVATGNLWSNGDTTQIIRLTTPGTYTLRTVAGACTSAASNALVVSVIDTAAPVIAVTRNTLCNAENAYVLRGTAQPSTDCASGFRLTGQFQDQLGYAWYRTQINLRKSFQLNFNANFGSINVDPQGADGIMCIFQKDPRGQNAVGGIGGGLGLDGLTRAFGIEFDTYQNATGDIVADHIAFDYGNVSYPLVPAVQASATSDNIEDNRYHNVKVVWNANVQTMKVYFDGVYRTSYTENIVSRFFNNDSIVYWGFSATTGGQVNNQSICGAFFFYDNNLDGQPDQVNDYPVITITNPDSTARYLWNDFYRDTTEFGSYLGNYSVRAIRGQCTSRVSNVVNISSITPASPVITPAGPITICLGDSVVLTSSVPVSNVWSDGQITNSIVVRNTGNYTVRQIDRACTSFASNVVTVTVAPAPPPPTIQSSRNPPRVCIGDTITLTSSALSRNLWSTGDTTRSIKVTATGTYTVQASNGSCYGGTSSPFQVLFSRPPAAPTVTPSGSVTVCEGTPVILTSDLPSGNIWSNFQTSQTITVTQSGIYRVRQLVNNCLGPFGDSIRVTILSLPPTPTITAIRPNAFCEGDSTILEAPLSFGYRWSTGDTTRRITVRRSTSISLSIIGNNGCQSFEIGRYPVTMYPLPATPVITALGPLEFCQGGSVTLAGPVGFTSYLWSNGVNSQNVTIANSDTLKLRVVNINGCTSAISLPTIVKVNPLPTTPTIQVIGSLAFCEDDSVTLSAPLSIGYIWSTGTTTQTIRICGNQRITLQVVNAQACTSASSLAVQTIEYRKPRPSINGVTTICPGLTGVVYKLQPDTMRLAAYQWFVSGGVINGSSTADSVVIDWGTIRTNNAAVKIITRSANGCQSDTTIYRIRINTRLTPVIPVGDTLICTNNLNRTYSTVNTASSQYNWQVSGGSILSGQGTSTIQVLWNPNLSVIHNLRYQETVSTADTICNGTSPTLKVRITPRPDTTLPIIGQKVFCGPQPAIRLRVAGLPRSTYSWTFPNAITTTSRLTDSALVFSDLQSGRFAISAIETSKDGCIGKLILDTLVINPIPKAFPGASQIVCSESSVILGKDTAPDPALNYRWSTTSSARSTYLLSDSSILRPTFKPLATLGNVTFKLIVTNKLTGCADSAFTTVFVNPKPAKPSYSYAGVTTFCAGDSIVIRSSALANTRYRWSTGDTTSSITVKNSSSIRLVTLNEFSCKSDTSDTLKIIVHPVPFRPIITAITDSIRCLGDSFTVKAPLSTSYLWSTGDTIQSITLASPTSVSVKVTNEFGCFSKESAPINLRYHDVAMPDLSKNNPWLCPQQFDGLVYSVIGLPNSTFEWSIMGGFIESNRPSQVTVNWTPGFNVSRNLSVTEITEFGCTNGPVTIIVRFDSLVTVPESGCKLDDFALDIPNVILPNSEVQINKTLTVKNLFLYPNSSIKIYNRWGSLVWKSDNYQNDWNAEGLPEGTYYFDFDSRRGKILKGWVQVLR